MKFLNSTKNTGASLNSSECRYVLLLKRVCDCFHWSSSPDEGQREDIVRVDSNEPITVFGVRVRVWVVRRQDKSTGASKVSSTRRYNGNKSIRMRFSFHKNWAVKFMWPIMKKGCCEMEDCVQKVQIIRDNAFQYVRHRGVLEPHRGCVCSRSVTHPYKYMDISPMQTGGLGCQ